MTNSIQITSNLVIYASIIIFEQKRTINTFPVSLRSLKSPCFVKKLVKKPTNVSERTRVSTITGQFLFEYNKKGH